MRNLYEGLVFRTDRLTLFAHFLNRLKFKPGIILLEDFDHLFHDEEVSVFPVFEHVIKSLPKLFKKAWSVNKEGEVIWLEKPHQCTLTSIMEFFQIEQALFIHLLVPYGQIEEYSFNGEVHQINKRSTSNDIAKNMFRIILIRQCMKFFEPTFNVISQSDNSLLN